MPTMVREQSARSDTEPARDAITIGLIGCGRWGINILRDLMALGCRVIVVDPDPTRRDIAASLKPASILEDISALPATDGIVIATPATTHADVIEAVLDRDVPVFCEKPLTTEPGSAARLADAGGRRLFVMHVWRYHRGIIRLADIARSGELGPILSLRTERKNWTSPRTDTDAIWTLLPHDLSIALAVLGAIPQPYCSAAELIDGKPVALTALLGRSPFFAVDCSTRYREKRREVRLHCRDGVAVLPGGESPFLEILRPDRSPDESPRVERQMLSGEPALLRQLRAFVDHVRGGPPPPTDAREAVTVVQAAAAVRTLAGL